MSGACWLGLGAFWRLLCRRLCAIKDHGPHTAQDGVVSFGGLPVGSTPEVKPNVDYSRFERLVKDTEAEERIPVAVCGRKGWNCEVVNGVYVLDGTLNGFPRLRKRDGSRWLKFTDDEKWMISRYPDGRPLGEAFAEAHETQRSDPKSIPGPWFVYSKDKWEEDHLISVTAAECAGCGKALQRIQRCSQCRAVSYCDHTCQKADWRFHKRLCQRRQPEGECQLIPQEQDTLSSCSVPKCVETKAAICASSGTSLAAKGLKFRRQNWEERDLLPWAKRRLEVLLEGSEEREGLPSLRVDCAAGGHVEVTGVKEIEGLASLWPQGDRRHLFDLSFQVVFKAFWLSDFAMMSMDGSVSFHDFTTDLVKDPQAFVCGMSVDFAKSSESCLDAHRTAMQTTISPASRSAIQEALGANAWAISRGHGLMHLVHLRLRHFADEFEAK